jgi:hypothetical protein
MFLSILANGRRQSKIRFPVQSFAPLIRFRRRSETG